eukprot:Nk52_evm8s564 gene=Nk52_evmTU8s564
MDTAFNSNPSAGKCHAVIQAVHYAITEKGCPSWSSDPEDAAFTNVGYVPYRNFYHDQCWKSCNATILTEMSKAVVGDPSRESIGCSLVSKAIRHAAVNMRACPVDPRDPKDSSNILLWNDACGYREIYFQSYCPGTCGYQIGRTFLLKVGKGDFPCMYNCDDSGKTVYEKEAAIAMNETLTQLREDERCKDFADARFLAPSVPSANNSQHTNPFISMNITSELVLSKEHDNLYATGYVTEIYPIRVLDPVDAVELPFIGRHRACLVGKRECLTLRAEDMVAKEVMPSNKYSQRWGRVCNCWNLGMDLMSEVFIRIWEFRKVMRKEINNAEIVNLVSKGYDAAANDFLKQCNDSRLSFPIYHRFKEIAKHLSQRCNTSDTSPHLLLDIGCGNGVPMARDLIDKDLPYFGIDSSKEQIRLCRDIHKEHKDRFKQTRNSLCIAAFLSICSLVLLCYAPPLGTEWEGYVWGTENNRRFGGNKLKLPPAIIAAIKCWLKTRISILGRWKDPSENWNIYDALANREHAEVDKLFQDPNDSLKNGLRVASMYRFDPHVAYLFVDNVRELNVCKVPFSKLVTCVIPPHMDPKFPKVFSNTVKMFFSESSEGEYQLEFKDVNIEGFPKTFKSRVHREGSGRRVRTYVDEYFNEYEVTAYPMRKEP